MCASACVLCLAALLALAGTLAPAALATGLGGGNSLSELTEAPEETNTSTTAATTTKSTEESGTSDKLVVLVLVAAVVLLSGIAFVIVRDARRVAPASEAEMIEAGASGHSAAALRRRRAKAKAARRQRKRNR
jgi:uncharacterized protein HemX